MHYKTLMVLIYYSNEPTKSASTSPADFAHFRQEEGGFAENRENPGI